jgi:hypothetical protein
MEHFKSERETTCGETSTAEEVKEEEIDYKSMFLASMTKQEECN